MKEKSQSGNRIHLKKERLFLLIFVLFLIAKKKMAWGMERLTDQPGSLYSNASTCYVLWELLADAQILDPQVGSFSILANVAITALSQ